MSLGDLAFWLREAVTWSPPARCPGPSMPADLAPVALGRVEALGQRYDLAPLFAATGPVERDESLYTLDLLDRFVRPVTAGERGLDVGSKYGAYLPGLATFGGAWDCVERDAHRRYLTGHTRRAVGETISARFRGCRFVAGDVRELSGSYSKITWFLPFVVPEPHTAWGLPASLFDPAGALDAVRRLLAPGGEALVVNQGAAEAEVQAALFREAGIAAEALGQVESVLSPYRKPRFGWRWRS